MSKLLKPIKLTLVICIAMALGCDERVATHPSSTSGTSNPIDVVIDWPQFRGPSGGATSDGAKIPVAWSDNDGIIWKSELPGRGASSPIVFDNKVFVTAYTGYGMTAEHPGQVSDLIHHVLCFDRETGRTLWTRNVKGSYANQKLNENLLGHGFASSTPVTDGKNVYTFFGVSGVQAFDVDGKFLWQADVGLRSDNFGSSASLTLFEDLLIVNASIEDKTVYAFNKYSGAAVWKIDDIVRTWTTPIIGHASDGSPELIISEMDTVHGYNPHSGKELWHCDSIPDYVIPTPVVVDGICYLNGGREKQMLAVKLGGRGDVTKSHKLWQIPWGANVSSLIYHKGNLYLVSDNGIMQCVDAANGETVKRKRQKTRKRVYASLVRAGDHFLLPTSDKGVLVLEARPNCKLVSENEFDGDDAPLKASAAVSGNQLFIRSDNFLYCIGKKDSDSRTIEHEFDPKESEIIIPNPKFDYDETKKRAKQYLNFFITDPDDMVKFILKPYESVITEEQTAQSEVIIKSNMDQFLKLRDRHINLKWRFMKAGDLTEDEYSQQLETIGDLTIKHNRKVRRMIKQMFSKEQMDQHLREAEARNKKK